MDALLRAALERHLLTLADSKRLLGIRYSDWLLGAPSIETAIAASSMAQDEWGHARLLYALLKELDRDPDALERERPAAAYASLDVLDRTPEDWIEVVAVMALVDGALTVALEGLAAGGWEPARARVPKMVLEEEYHRDLALAWFRRLGAGSADARDHLAACARRVAPATLAWLAPDDAPFRRLVEAGITRPGAELAACWLGRCGPLLEGVGVEATVEPARDGWDERRGRGPGQPDEEAVERARGDRNRALFVE